MFDRVLNTPLLPHQKLDLCLRKKFRLESSWYSEGGLNLTQLKVFKKSCFACLDVSMQTWITLSGKP